jgi:chromosome segregation ATPase
MAQEADRVSALADDVSYLQQDMAKIGTLVDRLDITIDKLAEVSTSLSQLLAVHETKISAQDAIVKSVSDLVEKRREEMEQNIKLLHARISSGEKEMEDKLDDRAESILEELKEMRAESAKQHEALNNRITVLEKWMWVVVGALAVLNFLGGNIDLGAFLG